VVPDVRKEDGRNEPGGEAPRSKVHEVGLVWDHFLMNRIRTNTLHRSELLAFWITCPAGAVSVT